ncbi:unnamed protein product [Paramecium octaurelia]|uniref:Uncharacterized protein n=1 Tax=Paramecium octaurelia TaxID=43137 RepID=A0A8S1VN80_PAROT|nr:unnamed protein product [Paramecium octaurelia]
MGITCSNKQRVIKEIDKIDRSILSHQNAKTSNKIQIKKNMSVNFGTGKKINGNEKLYKSNLQKLMMLLKLSIFQMDKLQEEEQKDISVKPQVLINLEQIYYLEWLGKYQENFKKMGKWTAIWKGEKITEVGGYYSNEGKKNGIWNDIIKNYGELSPVFEIGEYKDNQKIGQWIYVFEGMNIGGGNYSQYSKKEGKWIDLSDYFCNQCKVTYNGEYKNGKKVGRWDIYYDNNDGELYQLIGGGFYEDQIEGDSIKVGKWIDISDEFQDNQQITLSGEYKEGKKFGKWEIWWRSRNLNEKYQLDDDCQFQRNSNKEWEDQQIGGGSYDSEGYGIKIGRWTQLSDGFSQEYQVIYSGEYHNGKKVGRWDILAKKFDTIQTKPFKQIGGGSYVEGDEEFKIGEWIELDDDTDKHLDLFWKGEYKNDKKVGRWAFGWTYNDEFIELEGGSYHEGGEGIKVGRWKERYRWPEILSSQSQDGEYKNGKKVGRWNIVYPSKQKSVSSQIGGGLYHEDGNGIKIGKWIDQTEDIFLQSPSILYEGEYSNGRKIGEWGIFYLDDANKMQRIGGGSYDQQGKGLKIGSWIEINDEWNQRKQITQIGEYQNGRKVGQWIEMNLKKNQSHNIANYDN